MILLLKQILPGYPCQGFFGRQPALSKIFPIVLVSILLTIACSQTSTIKPTYLVCEAKSNPVGISTAIPRFSWQSITSENMQEQSAYQILVASSPDLLNEDKVDLWNSGKVSGSASTWILYKGIPLQSRSIGYWKIRVWDTNDKVSPWSELAHFSVGLLERNDWEGEYIGMRSNDESCTSPLLRKNFTLEKKGFQKNFSASGGKFWPHPPSPPPA